jgi:anti-sigma regulatory factor (Ser/Thr protein kinase)
VTLRIATDSFSTPNADGLIDHVHQHFPVPACQTEDEACVTRLLVHEWVANLIQHADFSETEPEIAIRFERSGGATRYVIEDNSNGFDLERYFTHRDALTEAFPSRGMGLMMMSSCSEHLAYRRVGPQQNRLEFVLKRGERFLNVGA